MGLAGQRQTDRVNWRVVLLFWAAICALLIARSVIGAARVPLLEDTDDAMRLAVVRDFLAGQGWYDHVQYRLNTPFGAEIHWSRLVDLPIGALILLFRPFAGAYADVLAAYAWPLLLLLCLLWLSARLTLTLVGREGILAALALPVLSPAVLTEFSPGRLDHHGVQILLTLALVWCTVEALQKPRWGIGAGLAAATAIAIGTEGLPVVATAMLVFGLVWVFRPTHRDGLRWFGISFAGGTLLHLAIALPPSAWFTPACDAISIVYVAGAILAGVGLVTLSLLPLDRAAPALRLLAAALVGAIALGALAALFPQCLRGPYAALDPWLVDNWLSRIAEAKTMWGTLVEIPNAAIALALPVLAAGAVLVVVVARGPAEDRAKWLVMGAFLAVATLVMLVQVRGARLAMPLAVPAAAWLIVRARQRYLAASGLGTAMRLVGSWVLFAGIALLLAVNLVTIGLERVSPAASAALAGEAQFETTPCLLPAAFVDLAGLPPARVMAPIDLGSHILAFTPHAVVAAPYHRNQQGIREAYEFFRRPIEEARQVLQERAITLVVVCPHMPEFRGRSDASEDSFAKLYANGSLPVWLEDVSLPETALRVFAVQPLGV